MRRKFPATMVSQHPDHATKPYWHTSEFITSRDEVQECLLSYTELGVSEYKWDWEGKLVDESILERLFSQNYKFFKSHPLGQDKFLTFRLPNPKVETEYRLPRAFTVLLTAAALAKEAGLPTPPLFEVILPMTESAQEMIDIQEAFREIAQLKHPLYKHQNGGLSHIEIIPLFEQVSTIIRSDQILKEYLAAHQHTFASAPVYIRPYLARSDPALNSGIVPTVLAIKIALSHYQRFTQENNVPLFPIIGSASLPFRGGLTPYTVGQFVDEYQGIKTALLQSAFRYDYPLADVIPAIKQLERQLPLTHAVQVSATEETKLVKLISIFEHHYRQTVEQIAPVINQLAAQLPPRRERVQHIGLFGYSRGVGRVKLPRAIGFTAALYSLGVPPELIGTGRGLKAAHNLGQIPLIEKYYLNLRLDLARAGCYLNCPLLEKMAKKQSVWKEILLDIKYIEKYLGITLGPQNPDHLAHLEFTDVIYNHLGNHMDASTITQAAAIRHSLG